MRIAHPIHFVAVTAAIGAAVAPVCALLALLVLGTTGYFGGHATPHREPGLWVVGAVFELGLLVIVVRAESARLAGVWLRRRTA